jgi:CheY-like chemotaxis protein
MWGPSIGRHFGWTGAFSRHMPASSHVLLSFLVLQARHAVTMLRHSVRPPALLGTLEVHQREPADVIVSDWEMPRMDGLELCKRTRVSESDHYTYFIFMTGLGDKERRQIPPAAAREGRGWFPQTASRASFALARARKQDPRTCLEPQAR